MVCTITKYYYNTFTVALKVLNNDTMYLDSVSHELLSRIQNVTVPRNILKGRDIDITISPLFTDSVFLSMMVLIA